MATSVSDVTLRCSICLDRVFLGQLWSHKRVHAAAEAFGFASLSGIPCSIGSLVKRRTEVLARTMKSCQMLPTTILASINAHFDVLKAYILQTEDEEDPLLSLDNSELQSVLCPFSAINCQACAVARFRNSLWRKEMQDSYFVETLKTTSGVIGLCGVFDGYYGASASLSSSKNFPAIFSQLLGDLIDQSALHKENIKSCFEQTFAAVDDILSAGESEASKVRWSGCSGTVAAVMNHTVYVSYVGDVRCLLVDSDAGVSEMTIVHNLSQASEKIRLEGTALSFCAKSGLLDGILATTRGLGNHSDPELKRAVLPVPDTFSVEVSAGLRHLILCTNSVLACLTLQEIGDLIRDSASGAEGKELALRIANLLVAAAVSLNCRDNITVLTVPFV